MTSSSPSIIIIIIIRNAVSLFRNEAADTLMGR